MKITMIGTGAYSLAMAKVLSANKNNKITFWTESYANLEKFKDKNHLNSIIPNYEFPEGVKITASYEEAVQGAQIIFIIVAAKYVDDVAENLQYLITKEQHIVICSKGIEKRYSNFCSDVWLRYNKTKKLAVISGPSFAIDIANGDPIGLTLATQSKVTKNILLDAFKECTVKLRHTTDILGVEICGSIKNVIAIAAGIVSGLGYSNSTSAFLISESVHDIQDIIERLGGQPRTILSFAGIGDLVLTCTTPKSRNFSFGYLIGSGASKKEIEDYTKINTVEGYHTIKSIYNLIKKKRICMPIIDLIYRVVINNEDPNLLIQFLLVKE